MKLRTTLTAVATTAVMALAMGSIALAHEKHQNLKVLEDNGKPLEQGMKTFSKGLGVKCNACHEKGKFESDTVTTKEDGRKFIEAVVGEKDQAKRDEALKRLQEALKLKDIKNAADVWEGVAQWKKKGAK